MDHFKLRRRLLGAAALACAWPLNRLVQAKPTKPLRIDAMTSRGATDVEKGFSEYFASRKIPVQIVYRDLHRDNSKMAGFLDKIRATRPASSTPGAPR